MRDLEKDYFRQLGHKELAFNDYSPEAINRAARKLNTFLFQNIRSKCESFDLVGIMTLQEQPVYKDALKNMVVGYEIEELLLQSVKAWDFNLIESSYFDTLFIDAEAREKHKEKAKELLGAGKYDDAQKFLITRIKKATIRYVEQCYNFIDFTAEEVPVDLEEGLVAKGSNTGVVKIYTEEHGWLTPMDYYATYNHVHPNLEKIGFNKEVADAVLASQNNSAEELEKGSETND